MARDRVALVTGGSAGLGLASAHDLYKRGFRVVLASRSVERLESAVDTFPLVRLVSAEALPIQVNPWK